MADSGGQLGLIARLTFRSPATKEGPAPTNMVLPRSFSQPWLKTLSLFFAGPSAESPGPRHGAANISRTSFLSSIQPWEGSADTIIGCSSA